MFSFVEPAFAFHYSRASTIQLIRPHFIIILYIIHRYHNVFCPPSVSF